MGLHAMAHNKLRECRLWCTFVALLQIHVATQNQASGHCNHAVIPRQRTISVSGMQIGGSGVLVLPMTYIFDEEPERWRAVLATLGLDSADPLLAGI